MRLRKLFAALLTLTLIFGAFAPVSQSQGALAEGIYSRAAEGEIAGLATVTGKLNLRAEPSASGAVLTTIPGGTDVVVVEWSEAWSVVIYTAQVNANCVSTWVGCVMSQYLDMYQVGGEIPDDPDVGGDTGWLEGVGTATVTGKLNLRAAPSTSAAVLLQIPAGMEVTVAEQSGDWSGVVYVDQPNDYRIDVWAGYVMTEYLSSSGEVPEEPGWDDPGEDEPGESETQLVASIINGDALWLRESPSASAAGLTKMYRGETIIVLERGDTWSRVQYGDLTGYAMSQYLEFREVPVEPEEPEDPDEPSWENPGEGETQLVASVVNGNALWLREGPSTSAAGLTMMYRGETIIVLERGDTWSRVQYGDLTGYAMSQYLEFRELPVGPEEPEDPDEPEQPAMTAVVSGSAPLRMREQPSTSAKEIGRIPGGAQVEVLEKGETWTKTALQRPGRLLDERLPDLQQRRTGAAGRPRRAGAARYPR